MFNTTPPACVQAKRRMEEERMAQLEKYREDYEAELRKGDAGGK